MTSDSGLLFWATVYITSNYCMCLVYNVQLTEIIIDFPSNKWVALTRAGWCVCCVCGRLSGKYNYIQRF